MDIYTVPLLSEKVDMSAVVANLEFTDAKYNNYKFQQCIDRNVVLIGLSKSGKSTIAGVLEDVFHKATKQKFDKEVRAVIIHNYMGPLAKGDARLHLTVIDTPGLFPLLSPKQKGLICSDNEDTRAVINACITQNVTDIHVFACVISLARGNITQQVVDILRHFYLHYHYLRHQAALVITHCEEFNEKEQANYISSLFSLPELISTGVRRGLFGRGVFFMGAIREECYDTGSSQTLNREYETVTKMRNTFIEMIVSADKPFNIHKDKLCSIF